MNLVPIVRIVLSLALLGFLVWVLITYVPMPELIKRLILLVVVVVVVLWLLGLLGIFA